MTHCTCLGQVGGWVFRVFNHPYTWWAVLVCTSLGPLWLAFPTDGTQSNLERRKQGDQSLWLDSSTATYQTYQTSGLADERELQVLVGSPESPVNVSESLLLYRCLQSLPGTNTSVLAHPQYGWTHPILAAWKANTTNSSCVADLGRDVSFVPPSAQMIVVVVPFHATPQGLAWEQAAVAQCIAPLSNALTLASTSLLDEYDELVAQDVTLFGVSLVTQTLLLGLVFGRRAWVLSLLAVGTILAAVASALGWVILFSNYNLVFFIMLFVLVSVGVDDAFLLNGIYHEARQAAKRHRGPRAFASFQSSSEYTAYSTTLALSAITSMSTFTTGFATPIVGIQQVSAFGFAAFGVVALLMYLFYTRWHVGWVAQAHRLSETKNAAVVEPGTLRTLAARLAGCYEEWWCQCTILLVYAVLTCVSASLLPQLKTDSDVTRLLPDDSLIRQFYERSVELTDYGRRPERIEWFSATNTSGLADWMVASPHLEPLCSHPPQPTPSGWRTTGSAVVWNAASESVWADVAADGNRVLHGGVWSTTMMYAETAGNSAATTFQTMLSSLAVLGALLLLFLPWDRTLLLVGLIATIDVNLLGWMVCFGISLDFFALLCIVIALGVSVDFSLHVALAAEEEERRRRRGLTAPTVRRRLRMRSRSTAGVLSPRPQPTRLRRWCRRPVFRLSVDTHLLWHLLQGRGKDMLISVTSTFVGIGVLGFARSDIFRSFFTIVAGIFTFGLLSGGLVLPAILCLRVLGQPPTRRRPSLAVSTTRPLLPQRPTTPLGSLRRGV